MWFFATVFGIEIGKFGLPPLVGMMIAGFVLINIGATPFSQPAAVLYMNQLLSE